MAEHRQTMHRGSPRQQVATHVESSTFDKLTADARKAGLTLSAWVAQIIEARYR